GDRPVIARALSKSPDDRYPNCTELIKSLRGLPASGSRTAPKSLPRLPTLDTEGQDTGDVITGRGAGAPPAPAPAAKTGKSTQCRSPALPAAEGPARRDEGTYTGTPRDSVSTENAAEPSQPRQAPAAVSGDGLLFPALVIGLGQQGLNVLRQLRGDLVEQ